MVGQLLELMAEFFRGGSKASYVVALIFVVIFGQNDNHCKV